MKPPDTCRATPAFGLTYSFLTARGLRITSLEPSDAGFGGYFEVGRRIQKVMGVDGSRWLPLKAEEATRTGNHFDVIFSNNVLEHIHDLDGTFRALKEVLKPDGSMIHNTVNYTVPYEPHFRIPLVPLFPRMTGWFKPSLRHSELWKG